MAGGLACCGQRSSRADGDASGDGRSGVEACDDRTGVGRAEDTPNLVPRPSLVIAALLCAFHCSRCPARALATATTIRDGFLRWDSDHRSADLSLPTALATVASSIRRARLVRGRDWVNLD